MSTAFLQVRNDASGVLSVGVNAVDNPVDLTVSGTWPAAYPFDVTCDSEILRVTSSPSAGVLRATRQVQGTSAAAHSVGATVELRVTAQSISDLNTAVNTLEEGVTPTDDWTVDLSAAQTQQLYLKGANVWTSNANAMVRATEAVAIGASGAFKAMQVDPPMTYTAATPANAAIQLFTFFPTITAPVSPLLMRGAGIYRDAASISMVNATAHGVLSTSGDTATARSRAWVTVESRKNFVAGTGGATATYPNILTLYAVDTIDTGWTVENYRLAYLASPGGAGTITNIVALDLEDYGARAATLACSVRSAGAAVQLRHAGPGVFGANAAPTNASVGLEVQSTTKAFLLPRMTTTQRDALTALDGMLIYNTTTAQPEKRIAGAWTAF